MEKLRTLIKICGLTCCGKQWSQRFSIFEQKRGACRKVKKTGKCKIAWAAILMRPFCNTCSDFNMEKTDKSYERSGDEKNLVYIELYQSTKKWTTKLYKKMAM